MGNMDIILKKDTKPPVERDKIRSKRWFRDMIGWIDDCIGNSQRESN